MTDQKKTSTNEEDCRHCDCWRAGFDCCDCGKWNPRFDIAYDCFEDDLDNNYDDE
jgi:hypothetical protein